MIYFIGKIHFEQDGTQNYLVFQPIKRYFKIIGNTKFISSWKSKGLSGKTIKPYVTSNNSLTLLIDYSQISLHVVMEQKQTFILFISLALLVLTMVILH